MFVATLMTLAVLGASHGPSAPAPPPGASSASRSVTVASVMANVASGRRMPLFARRFNVACNFCHTTIPRLNYTGYKFRAAGFRMPEDIGTESKKKFELGDFFSARIQSRFDMQATNQPNGAAVANLIAGKPGDRTTTIAASFM